MLTLRINKNSIGLSLACFAILLFSQSADAQLQIPKQPGKNFSLKPDEELAKQLSGLITIKMKHDGKNFYGTPLAYDGKTIALLRWDGRVTKLPAKKEKQFEIIDRNFLPYTHEELKERLKKEFGSRYVVSTTEHYVVVHPPGKAAIWAEPFENLHLEFVHWAKHNGLKPTDPQFPMVAVVLRSRRDFDLFMKNDIKIANRSIQGFYSNKSNRMVMFDPSSKVRVDDQTWLYRDPTIVHEATHQSAFNTRVQNRFSQPPLWMAEGLAMLFESPGYSRSRKFTEPKHRVNQRRLAALRKMKPHATLPAKMVGLVGNNRLYETEPVEYYNLAWGLTWFLAEERHDQLIRYMKKDASRKAYTSQSQLDELKLFSKYFGNDMEQLKRDIGDFYADKL